MPEIIPFPIDEAADVSLILLRFYMGSPKLQKLRYRLSVLQLIKAFYTEVEMHPLSLERCYQSPGNIVFFQYKHFFFVPGKEIPGA